MGFDVKEIQVHIRSILEFFVNSCCAFVKKYPVVFGILTFLFLLFVFLPSLFTFLIFFVPIVIFISLAFRLIFKIHQRNLKDAKGEIRNLEVSSKKPGFVENDDHIVDRRKDFSVRTQSVRRVIAKEKDKQVFVKEGVEDKGMVFSTISNDAFVDKSALMEENPKEIREVIVDSATGGAGISFAKSQQLRPEIGQEFNGGGAEAECSVNAEDEDERETPPDYGNRAVKWAASDQKSFVDLGDSEMERNKRLESLIARRKVRKLLSLQVRKTLMNLGKNDPRGQIASLLIPKTNPFLPNSSGEVQVSPTPSSAPSVLLPMQNPFDLPYDPQEEKPNLTGDSFQQEFMEAQRKNIALCRQESFGLGAAFPGPMEFDQSRHQNLCSPRIGTRQTAPEKSMHSRLRNSSGNEDASLQILAESFQCSHDHAGQQGEASEQVFNLDDINHEEDRSEVHRESNTFRGVSGGSGSSSSSELSVPFSTAGRDETLKPRSLLVLKNIAVDGDNNVQRDEILYDFDPSSFEKSRLVENLFFADEGANLDHRHSIASDLQVEMSEVSSTGMTVDETISPPDGEFLMYDGDLDMEKDAASGSEEIWIAPPKLPNVEENESKANGLHEVCEQDIIDVGFARIDEIEDPIESSIIHEKVVEQDSIESGVPSSMTKLPERSQTHSVDFIASNSYSSEGSSIENLASTTLANEQQSTESEFHPSHCSNSQKLEEQSSCSPEELVLKGNIIYDMNDEEFLANDNTLISDFIKDAYGEAEAPILVEQEAPEDPSVPTMKYGAKSIEIVAGNSEDPENGQSNPTEYPEGEFQEQSDHRHIAEGSDLRRNMNIQDRKGKQGDADIGSSGANQNSDDFVASVVQLDTATEQGPTNSSSSSSPNYREEANVSTSQGSLSNFDQTTEMEHHKFGADMVDNNLWDKPLPESSNLPAIYQDEGNFTEGSVTYVSNDRDPEKPSEPDIIVDSNEPEDSMNHDIRNSKIIKDVDIQEFVSNPIVSNEDHYEQQGKHQTLESFKPAEETDDSKLGETSSPVENNDVSETTLEHAVSSSNDAFGLNLSFVNDPNPPAMVPEVAVEHHRIDSSMNSSPKSVLQKDFSIDRSSIASFDQDTQMEAPHQSETEVEENNMLDGVSVSENLRAMALPSTVQSMEDSG